MESPVATVGFYAALRLSFLKMFQACSPRNILANCYYFNSISHPAERCDNLRNLSSADLAITPDILTRQLSALISHVDQSR